MSSKGSASGAQAEAKRALRVGVIGAGVMGSNHARVLAGLPDTTLVGIVDPLPAHRARATELTGCRAFTNLDELVAEGVDAVTIAAPTHLHHEISLACIARGIHVLVEKPIASTVEEGRDIVAAAHRAGVTLMVGHVERFNPAVAAIKQAISGGASGMRVIARVTMMSRTLSTGIPHNCPRTVMVTNIEAEGRPVMSETGDLATGAVIAFMTGLLLRPSCAAGL